MAKKTETIFKRAQAAAENGTSKECAELIQEIEELVATEREERNRIAPPSTALRHDGGVTFSTDVPAGPDYQEAVNQEDEKAVEQMERRHRMLKARVDQASRLLRALRSREKSAREKEAKAAAPGGLKKRQKALPQLLERTEAALAEARTCLADCNAWLNEVEELRELAEDDGEMVDAATLYRLGRCLRHRVLDRSTWRVGSPGKPGRDVPALFGNSAQLARAERLLGVPEPGILDRAKRFLFGSEPTSRQERTLMRDLRHHRARLLAAGDVEAAGDFETLEKGAVAASYNPRTAPNKVEEFSG